MKNSAYNPYYEDGEILEALALQCRSRELWLRREDVPSHRPLKADSVEELKRHINDIRGEGIVSVYASVEVFSDPLLLTLKSPEDLRTGWELFIDLDSPNYEDAKTCAVSIAGLLKTFSIKNFKVKFSGKRGFHIIVPGSAFDCFGGGSREFIQAFPLVPKHVCRFLMVCLKPNQRRGVKMDLDVYKPRQMMRLAYSLHHDIGLVSLPLRAEEIEGFQLEDAKPDRLNQIDWEWLHLKPEIGEAYKLLKATAEWIQQNKTEPAIKIIEPGKAVGKAKSRYGWIEHLLVNPVDDGRHRLLWLVIAPYLVNVKNMSNEAAKQRALQYLTACSKMRTLNGDPSRLVDYYIEYAKRKRLKPLSFHSLKTKYPDLYEIVKR